MGHWRAMRATALAAAVPTGGAPAHAVLPLVAGLGKQIVQAMKDAPPADRKAFQDGFGAGFFPPDVVSAVKAQLR